MSEIRDWKCGHCGLVIDLPDYETEHDGFVAALNHVREHRWAHLVTALESGSDRELMGLCEDEPAEPVGGTSLSMDNLTADQRRLKDAAMGRPAYRESEPLAEPVDSDDVTLVLEGISELLRDDLPRARRLWYPINEDGGFNR